MASTAVFWNYQRKLSGQGENEDRRKSVDFKVERTAARKESESSVVSCTNDETERRVSHDSSDDEAGEHGHEHDQTKKSKGRRFSLDFLFSRRKSKDKGERKQKSKRSQSNTTETNEQFVAYRYPGFNGAEFALAM